MDRSIISVISRCINGLFRACHITYVIAESARLPPLLFLAPLESHSFVCFSLPGCFSVFVSLLSPIRKASLHVRLKYIMISDGQRCPLVSSHLVSPPSATLSSPSSSRRKRFVKRSASTKLIWPALSRAVPWSAAGPATLRSRLRWFLVFRPSFYVGLVARFLPGDSTPSVGELTLSGTRRKTAKRSRQYGICAPNKPSTGGVLRWSLVISFTSQCTIEEV